MSDTPQTGWTSGSAETFSELPVDEEKERAFKQRQEESKALVDAAISPLVEERENEPVPEPDDNRDLEETVHDLFADRRTLDRKAHAQRLGRMAARGRDEFGGPLPKGADLLYEHGVGVSPEALARFQAELDREDEDEEYED